jgi:hypothetical protein
VRDTAERDDSTAAPLRHRYVSVVVLYLGLFVLFLLLLFVTLSRGSVFDVLVMFIAAVVLTLLGYATLLGLYLDTRHVRTRASWTPRWWYYVAVAVVGPVVVIFTFEPFASDFLLLYASPLVVVAAVHATYLLNRIRHLHTR